MAIKKSEKHDSLAVWGQFPCGGVFRLSITRSGERASWLGSRNRRTNEMQARIFVRFCKFRPGESNGGRVQRIYDTALQAQSAAGFVELMK